MLRPMSEWAFLTNHAQVLVRVAGEPGVRIRDIAESIGVTERAAHRFVCDLVEAGYLTRRRVGRRNCYEIHPELPLRPPLEGGPRVGEILSVLVRKGSAGPPTAT